MNVYLKKTEISEYPIVEGLIKARKWKYLTEYEKIKNNREVKYNEFTIYN